MAANRAAGEDTFLYSPGHEQRSENLGPPYPLPTGDALAPNIPTSLTPFMGNGLTRMEIPQMQAHDASPFECPSTLSAISPYSQLSAYPYPELGTPTTIGPSTPTGSTEPGFGLFNDTYPGYFQASPMDTIMSQAQTQAQPLPFYATPHDSFTMPLALPTCAKFNTRPPPRPSHASQASSPCDREVTEKERQVGSSSPSTRRSSRSTQFSIGAAAGATATTKTTTKPETCMPGTKAPRNQLRTSKHSGIKKSLRREAQLSTLDTAAAVVGGGGGGGYSPDTPEQDDEMSPKAVHNRVERKYRERLNEEFERLVAVLPPIVSAGEGEGEGEEHELEGCNSSGNSSSRARRRDRQPTAGRRQRQREQRRWSKAEALETARRHIGALEARLKRYERKYGSLCNGRDKAEAAGKDSPGAVSGPSSWPGPAGAFRVADA